MEPSARPDAPGARAWRRRSARWLGSLLILAGVVGLAWVATITLWQDPLTAIYAKRSQSHLSSAYEERVRKIQPTLVTPAAKRVPLATVARRFRTSSSTGQAVGRLVVPRMGLSTVIVAGTDTASLQKGPGLDERTHMPGEGQLVYIAGHRTTYLAPFSHIDRLKPGDRVQLSTPYARFEYRVTGHAIVPATDVGRLQSRGYEELALQACHPRFFATQRYIVYARLVGVQRIHGIALSK